MHILYIVQPLNWKIGNCNPTYRDRRHGYNFCNQNAKLNKLKEIEPGKKIRSDNDKSKKTNKTVFIVYTFDQIKHKLYLTD